MCCSETQKIESMKKQTTLMFGQSFISEFMTLSPNKINVPNYLCGVD